MHFGSKDGRNTLLFSRTFQIIQTDIFWFPFCRKQSTTLICFVREIHHRHVSCNFSPNPSRFCKMLSSPSSSPKPQKPCHRPEVGIDLRFIFSLPMLADCTVHGWIFFRIRRWGGGCYNKLFWAKFSKIRILRARHAQKIALLPCFLDKIHPKVGVFLLNEPFSSFVSSCDTFF